MNIVFHFSFFLNLLLGRDLREPATWAKASRELLARVTGLGQAWGGLLDLHQKLDIGLGFLQFGH